MLSNDNNNQIISFKRGLSLDKKLMAVELFSLFVALGIGVGVGTGLSYLDRSTVDHSTGGRGKSSNLWHSTFNSLIVILTYILITYAFENHVCNKIWIRALSLGNREGLPLIQPEHDFKNDSQEFFNRFNAGLIGSSIVKKKMRLAKILGFILGCGLGTAVGTGLFYFDKKTDDLSSADWQYSDNLWHSTIVSFLAILPYLLLTKVTECVFERKIRPFVMDENEGNPLLVVGNISKNLANYN